MNRLFAALLAILLLALPIAAFAEGETPPAETQAPVTTPNPTLEPTPEPTPVADKLIIDSWSLYDGMDKTYQQGYVPRIVNGCCYIIFPLIGETYDGKVTVTADLGATADSPFVFGNYSQTAAGWGRYVFMFEIPLVKGRINGSYPVTLKADYLDVLGQQKQQNFTVFVTVSDGKKPKDPDAKEAAEKPELFISACEITPDTVGGDGEFSVNVKIDNIGSIRARSVRLTYGSEAEGILPYDTNNASTIMPPLRLTSRPLVVDLIRGLGEVPSAIMTQSTSISYSLPSTGMGRRRPEASGSPSSIFWQFMAHTLNLSSPFMERGVVSRQNSMPSSFACSTSSRLAGSSLSLRRYTILTSAPSLLAQRAASMATLPPPTTATCLPCMMGVSLSSR